MNLPQKLLLFPTLDTSKNPLPNLLYTSIQAPMILYDSSLYTISSISNSQKIIICYLNSVKKIAGNSSKLVKLVAKLLLNRKTHIDNYSNRLIDR